MLKISLLLLHENFVLVTEKEAVKSVEQQLECREEICEEDSCEGQIFHMALDERDGEKSESGGKSF
jgi:hypothetical protein